MDSFNQRDGHNIMESKDPVRTLFLMVSASNYYYFDSIKIPPIFCGRNSDVSRNFGQRHLGVTMYMSP
jgi:hypothetical protein